MANAVGGPLAQAFAQTDEQLQRFIETMHGVPIWKIEKRGMTEEEAKAYKDEYEQLQKKRGRETMW